METFKYSIDMIMDDERRQRWLWKNKIYEPFPFCPTSEIDQDIDGFLSMFQEDKSFAVPTVVDVDEL